MIRTGISVLDSVDPLIHKGIVLVSIQATMTHAKIQRVVQEGLIIRADIENDGQDGSGADSTSSNVLESHINISMLGLEND